METDAVRQDAIRQALERVLSSSGFARNERLSGFLRFLVERHLEGRDSELKESVIAHEVFGREADYDPKLDAIVRTEAVRLRARLEKYYQTDGSQDPWIIDLPKGGYRPVVRQRLAVEPATDIPPGRPERAARVSRIRWTAGAVAALVLVAIAAAWWWTRPGRQALTIAVLPLENQGDPANEYFADGLTDEIIRNLSLIEGVTVPSRTSSFAIKGKGLTPGEAGRQLGADYLVEGSVLHAGDQLRITVALVRARDEHRLWSDRFDRTLTDVFAIQDEISRGIVNTLRLNLSPGRRRYETNLEAYDLYLRGRHLMASFPAPRGRPIALPAVKYFEQAIAKDGNYAIAYAGMADALIAIERNVGTANPWGATILSKAKDAAERAIKLDPMLSEGHSAMASIRAREYAWQEAERGFRQAIELNPNNALAHLELGTSVLVVQGRFDEGLREVRRALDSIGCPPTSTRKWARRSFWRDATENPWTNCGKRARWIKAGPDRTTCSAARSRCRGNQTRHSRRSTRASSAALPHRSGWRVPKCVRDDATRRSVSCKGNSATPVHRGSGKDLCVPRR